MSKIAVIGLVGESVFLTVDKHQAVGETAHATSIHREWGGKGYNQAVAAARYGASVAFLGAASTSDTEAIKRAAGEDNIRAYIAGKSDATAYGVIVTDATGDNRVTVYGGAALEAWDVEGFAEEIAGADILLINNEVPEAVNVRAVEIARSAGTRVIYNPAPVRPICDYLLTNTDIFTPNEHEYAAVADFKNCIVTLGSEGCLIKWLDEKFPAFALGEAVDTTGAGDTFNGVLAAALAEGCDAVSASVNASAAAALEVTKSFVMPAIPKRKEIEKIIEKDL